MIPNLPTHRYKLDGPGKWTKTVTVEDAVGPLAEAVKAAADANPGEVIVGIGVNGGVDYVGLLERNEGA